MLAMIPDEMRLFILTAKHQSVTKAAEEIHLSQSSVSRKLKQLQVDLNNKFLKKRGRGVELTKSGRTFLNEILPIFTQLDALEKKYKRSRETLIVGCNHDSAAEYMSPAMAQFGERYPSVDLTLHVGSSAEMEEMLLSSKLDLAVVTNLNASSLSLFITEPFQHDSLVAFVVPNHPLANKSQIQSSERGEIRLVIRTRREGYGRSEMELDKLAKTGIKFKIVMRCESADAVKHAVKHGGCVGILYRNAIKRELDRGEFKIVKIAGFDVIGQSHIAYSKDRLLSPLAKEFLTNLRASVPIPEAVTPPATAASIEPGRGKARVRALGSNLLLSWIGSWVAIDWILRV
jgi:DNA-binding transcriptional LysR family regulator